MKRYVFFLLSAFAIQLNAATFQVVTIIDRPDTDPGDGVCNSTLNGGSNDCTLRAAIEEANALSGADVIEFDFTNGTSKLAITLTEGVLPTITETLTIDGTSVAGYQENSTILTSRPRIFVQGQNLSNINNDGFRFAGSGAANSIVKGIGIINFPDNGIEVVNSASPVFIDANWIGVDYDGTSDAGNGGAGVYSLTDSTIVGSTLTDEVGNLISGNDTNGVEISGDFSNIQNNFVGVDTLFSALGNGSVAVSVIGDNGFITGNDISNSNTGILNNGSNITVNDNFIVDNDDGILHLGNSVLIDDNVIVNHSDISLELRGSNGTISNNSIQQSANSAVVLSNSANGNNISDNLIFNNTGGNAIHLISGTNNELRGNQIYNTTTEGIHVESDNNYLGGNFIGFDNSTQQASPIGGNGMVIFGDNNVIGELRNGTAAGNVIGAGSSSLADGVDIRGNSNKVIHNHIGVFDDGGNGVELEIGNNGVYIFNADSNTVRDNFIGFAAHDGVAITGDSSDNGICSNEIGVMFNGQMRDIGNTYSGINVSADNNVVGTANECTSGGKYNFVGFNGDNGVYVNSASNRISRTFSGGDNNNQFPNDIDGLRLFVNAAENDVYDFASRNNVGNGITTVGSGEQNHFGAIVTENNGGLGIDLADNGVTENDAGDVDLGSNKLMNFPEITQIISHEGAIEVSYRLDYDNSAGTEAMIYFALTDGNDNRQGARHISDVKTYDVAPNTLVTQMITLPNNVPSGTQYLVARASDIELNSSEYSENMMFTNLGAGDLIFRDGFED